jgi:hypothetical protein
MWRGYGGNGRGAAVVLDMSKLTRIHDSPLIVSKVFYGTAEERIDWFNKAARITAEVISRSNIPDQLLGTAGHYVFNRLKLFALFTKHHGFLEEQEWRIVYLRERDPNAFMKHMLHYSNGPRGVEPKLRLPVGPIEGVTQPDLSFEKIVHSIILGPSTASPLAHASVARMLDLIGKPGLKNRLHASTSSTLDATGASKAVPR